MTRLNAFRAAVTLRLALAAVLLLAGLAAARLNGEQAGALASGIPARIQLCSGTVLAGDGDEDAARIVHCSACIVVSLPAVEVAAPPPLAGQFSTLAVAGQTGVERGATPYYAARAPPLCA